MLCRSHYKKCTNCINDDNEKTFSSLPIVFGRQVSKLELF